MGSLIGTTPLPPVVKPFIDLRYATKHSVSLWLRVFPAPPQTPHFDNGRPWIMWVHGGAYCSGDHHQPRLWLIPLFHSMGIHVVSIAHRLAPHVNIEAMVEDCISAAEFCTHTLPARLQSYGGCNGAKFAIGGDSSGAHLATLTALRLTAPSPSLVIDLYGPVDPVRQQATYDAQPTDDREWDGHVTLEEAAKLLQDHDPAHAVCGTPSGWNLRRVSAEAKAKGRSAIMRELKGWWGVSDEEWVWDHRTERQWDLRWFIGRTRATVSAALHLTHDMPDVQKKAQMERYSLPTLLKQVESYPPTIIWHGTEDKQVLRDISEDLGSQLKEMKVDTLELYPEGLGHGDDNHFEVSTIPLRVDLR